MSEGNVNIFRFYLNAKPTNRKTFQRDTLDIPSEIIII